MVWGLVGERERRARSMAIVHAWRPKKGGGGGGNLAIMHASSSHTQELAACDGVICGGRKGERDVNVGRDKMAYLGEICEGTGYLSTERNLYRSIYY